jgi:hypothetical protein
MASDDVAIMINQDRDVETKDLDTTADLPDLLFAVAPRVGGVKLELV